MGKDGAHLIESYGNRVRLRVSGICIENEMILLVGHRLPGHQEVFWAPPGGGVQYGETARESLSREFLEETGLRVVAGKMLFLNEFIEPPLHAMEIFFKIDHYEGKLSKGSDPEFSVSSQIIDQVRFMGLEEIRSRSLRSVHRIFWNLNNLRDIFGLVSSI